MLDADDCEGRSQQGCIHVRQLYVSIYLDARYGSLFIYILLIGSQSEATHGRDNGRRNVNAHFVEKPPNRGCLRFASVEAMDPTLDACSALGYLLHSDRLAVRMTVGEAVFDPQGAPDDTTGHAFGFACYKGDGIILEGTAWDRTAPKATDEPEQHARLRALVKKVCARDEVSIALPLAHSLAHSLAHYI